MSSSGAAAFWQNYSGKNNNFTYSINTPHSCRSRFFAQLFTTAVICTTRRPYYGIYYNTYTPAARIIYVPHENCL